MSRRNVQGLQIATHVGALTPLAVLAWAFWRGQLGPVPVEAVTRRLGRYALALLLLSLVPTTVRIMTGYRGLLRVRRWLGLYAFLHALLHFLAFSGLDYGFNLGLIVTTVLESRREIAGLAALAILSVLALTSLPELVRRLGKTWKPLHRLVYVATALVVLHYVWNYKELRTWPVVRRFAVARKCRTCVPHAPEASDSGVKARSPICRRTCSSISLASQVYPVVGFPSRDTASL